MSNITKLPMRILRTNNWTEAPSWSTFGLQGRSKHLRLFQLSVATYLLSFLAALTLLTHFVKIFQLSIVHLEEQKRDIWQFQYSGFRRLLIKPDSPPVIISNYFPSTCKPSQLAYDMLLLLLIGWLNFYSLSSLGFGTQTVWPNYVWTLLCCFFGLLPS